jgi:hypothetical protein
MSPDVEGNEVPEDLKDQIEHKRRGPRKASEIRAEVEAEMRAQFEVEREQLKKQYEAAEKVSVEEAQEAAMAAFQKQIRKNESVSEQVKSVEIPEVPADAEGALTVNFVEDGLTLLGKVWYVGEELTIVPGTPQWEEAMDVSTQRVLISLDEDEQIARWKKRYFRPGHWRGVGFDLNDPSLSEEERQRLQSIQDKKAWSSPMPSGSSTTQKRSPVAY